MLIQRLRCLRTDEVQRFTDELKLIFSAVLHQINRLERQLILRRPQPNSLFLKPHGHLECPFGAWYHSVQHPALREDPEFRRLGEEHRDCFRRAARLMADLQQDRPLDAAAYDAYLAAQERFLSSLQKVIFSLGELGSSLDHLTGLPNRKAFLDALRTEVVRAVRQGHPTCLVYADIDFFKAINDTHGHPAGDEVLRAVARCFVDTVRRYDLVARYGGEEFVFCLPETTLAEGLRVMERVRTTLAGWPILLEDGRSLYVTASFGLAELDPRRSLRDNLQRADRALYRAKRAGRNRCHAWRDEPSIERAPASPVPSVPPLHAAVH